MERADVEEVFADFEESETRCFIIRRLRFSQSLIHFSELQKTAPVGPKFSSRSLEHEDIANVLQVSFFGGL